jgi:DNA (cytosine-5)-methyltransferase 1
MLREGGQWRWGNEQSPVCVGYSEIDKFAEAIYKHNYEEGRNYGDATKIRTGELPDFDLLVGGFPCQAFSVAGKRRGFDDTRGTLFFEIARICRDKRPRYILLENVKGLLSHDNGKTFTTILGVLTALGYDLQWQVLNSKDFGVPQNRERVFIVGYLAGEGRRQVFPIGECTEGDNERFGKAKVVGSLTGGGHSGGHHSTMTILKETQKLSDAKRIRDVDGCSVTLKGLGGGQGAKTGLYAVPDLRAPNSKKIDLAQAPDRPFQICETRTEEGKKTRKEIREKEGRDSTKRGKDDKKYVPKNEDTANCLTTAKENVEKWLFEGSRVRRLTPVECERLQGFPDDWTRFGEFGDTILEISDTQRYKCLGNAVTTNVVQAIIARMF